MKHELPMPTEEIEKVLKNPITTHALLELMIEQGVKISVDHSKLNHTERVKIIRAIIDELEARERLN